MLDTRRPAITGLMGAPMPEEVTSPDAHRLVKSGARVLEILEFFAETGRPAVGLEIATALDLPISSANDLLKSLVEAGYLLFERSDKTYFPSPRVLRLATSFGGWGIGANCLLDVMAEIQDASGECVTISAQNDLSMQFVTFLPTPGVVPDRPNEGLKFPIIGTASGTVILAAKRNAEALELVARITAGRPSQERMEIGRETLEHVRRTRRNGYAVSFRDLLPDAMSIAIALRGAGGVALALCIGGARERLLGRERETAQLMRDVVQKRLFAQGA